MEKLPEMTLETFEALLGKAGMPLWATWLEEFQAARELPNGTPEQIYARTYQILCEKFEKQEEGA